MNEARMMVDAIAIFSCLAAMSEAINNTRIGIRAGVECTANKPRIPADNSARFVFTTGSFQYTAMTAAIRNGSVHPISIQFPDNIL